LCGGSHGVGFQGGGSNDGSDLSSGRADLSLSLAGHFFRYSRIGYSQHWFEEEQQQQ
jgi:hypothetical protein